VTQPAGGDRLAEILRASPSLMQVLQTLAALDLPDWLVFSGAVYQAAWNHLTSRPPGHGLRDIDVGYFDPDTSWDAEDQVIRRVAAALPPALPAPVQVRNQARVHLWFEAHFGEPYAPLASTEAALSRFVAPAFAVGVRLRPDGSLHVAAPFGLADLFALRLRPNPDRPLARAWPDVVRSVRERWPEVSIEGA
jgi:uncharacterized protein